MRFATAILDFSVRKGGAERYLVDLCTRMTKEGYEVHVYAEHWEEDIPGVFLHKVKTIPFPKSLRLLSFAMKATKEMKKGNYDITLGVGNTLEADVHQPRGGVHWAWFWRSLRAYDNPILWMIKFLGRILSPKQWVRGWIESQPYRSKKLPIFIAIADMIKQDMMNWHKIPEERIIVDYNGVDIERFHPRNRRYREEVRKKYNIGNEFVILFVSNNFRMKGLKCLIETLANIKKEGFYHIKLIVLGKDHKGFYHRLATRCRIAESVIFVGSTGEPEKYYGAADILVHPTFYDACSRAVLEAMASGLPVITTTYNGACGIITDGQEGFVIEDPRNIQTLSERISFFFDEEKRKKASIRARQRIEGFSFDRNYTVLKGIFHRCMERKK